MKTQTEVKNPIASTLKEMGLFKTVTFPLSRMSSVRTTIQIIKTEKELNFTTRKNNKAKCLEVTRIA